MNVKPLLVKAGLFGVGLMVLFSIFAGVFHSMLDAQRERANQLHGGVKVAIYTLPSCSNCMNAKAYMDKQGIAYREYNIDDSTESRKNFTELGGQGVPLIFVNGRRMEGFRSEEFAALYGQ